VTEPKRRYQSIPPEKEYLLQQLRECITSQGTYERHSYEYSWPLCGTGTVAEGAVPATAARVRTVVRFLRRPFGLQRLRRLFKGNGIFCSLAGGCRLAA